MGDLQPSPQVRNLDALLMAVILPLVILLLFTYVFGGAIATDGTYLDYVVPGIILLCADPRSASTAVSVATDTATGNRRPVPVAADPVLGRAHRHVVASVVRNLGSTALVFGVALLLGFRPHAGLVAWLAVVGLLTLFMLAISWCRRRSASSRARWRQRAASRSS